MIGYKNFLLLFSAVTEDLMNIVLWVKCDLFQPSAYSKLLLDRQNLKIFMKQHDNEN